LSAHLTHKTETTPSAIAPEARNTAAFCHRLRLSAKKARYSVINANQNTVMRMVPVILVPNGLLKTSSTTLSSLTLGYNCVFDYQK
jgi:hypothetical protein